MNDDANIRFVNSHAKSIGTSDDPGMALDPFFLFLFSVILGESGMVKITTDTMLPDQVADFFCSSSCSAVDDSCTLTRFQQLKYPVDLVIALTGPLPDPSQIISFLSTCKTTVA